MMGPLITSEHRDRVQSYVEGAADEGAKVVVDGSTDVAGMASSSVAPCSTT